MALFEIDNGSFISFLSQAHLDGLVLDCVISAKNGQLTTKGTDTSRAIFFRVSTEAQIQKPGIFTIGDIAQFMKILTRFSDTVSISADEKQLIIKQKRKIGRFEVTPLKNIESFANVDAIKFEKNSIKTPALKVVYKTNNFIVRAEQLKELVGDADILDEHTYYILIDKAGVKAKVKRGKNSITTNLQIKKPVLKKEMSVCFGHGIKEIFKSLEGKVKIFLEKDPPMLIRFGDKYSSLYLLMTKEEEGK